MDLQIVNQDLSESKLFRTTNSFRNLSGREIADLLYLSTLSLIMMYRDTKQQDYAIVYAKKTAQYGPYAVFRTAATDMYMLGFAVDNPDYKNLKFRGKDESFLNALHFQNRKHYMFMQRLARQDLSKSDITTFLFRLETQLKIDNPVYKQLRRLIIDWDKLKYSQRQMVVSRIIQHMRLKGRGSELFVQVSSMSRRRELKPMPKSNTLKRAGATALGAYAGSKILPKVSNKISSVSGAGIGAIAGYWASGRKKA
jgi:hypothetical protein